MDDEWRAILKPQDPNMDDTAQALAQARLLDMLASLYARCDGVRAFICGLEASGFALANGDEECSYLLVHSSGWAVYLPKFLMQPGGEAVHLWAYLAEEKPPGEFPNLRSMPLPGARAPRTVRSGGA